MILKYHQRTLDLLQRPPEVSSRHVAVLDQLEQQHNIRLPDAVREWYSLSFATDVLWKNDFPVSVDELGMVNANAEDYGYTIDKGYLPVMWENQSVSIWCVLLDGSDNPPVVEREPDAPERAWRLVAPSFSDYIFCLIWDSRMWKEYRLYSSDFLSPPHPLSNTTLEQIKQYFVELLEQYAACYGKTLRFFRRDQCIKIETLLNHGNSIWQLHADTPDSLFELANTVWHYDNLAEVLQTERREQDTGAVLDRLRNRWEYQLSCSYPHLDHPFTRENYLYLGEHLKQERYWMDRRTDGAGYSFENPGKRLYIEQIAKQNIVYWRIRGETLSDLRELAQLIWKLGAVSDNLKPDTYAKSYDETLSLLRALRR